MQPYLFRINESNKLSLNRQHESNRIYYSELNEWDTNNAFRSFSLKYVIDGVIKYKVGNEIFEVKAGSFLIADRRDDVSASFQSSLLTRSICIDINTEIVSEAATLMAAKDEFNFENYLDHYFKNSVLCQKIYSSDNNELGEKLKELANALANGDQTILNDEWFLEAAELVILQEKGNYLALNGIKSVKVSTRLETLFRLEKGKEYMNDQFLRNPGIAEVAKACNMSEFHFFRSFKQAFGITPYKYLLNKRLEYSKLLLQKKCSAKEIATCCGFADIFTFSKAFKREYGIAPTIYQRQFQK